MYEAVGLLGALTPEEQAGGLLAPIARNRGGIGILDILGPSVMNRMQQASGQQQARWQGGERSPTPLTEENVWLADDVAGGLLGPVGMMAAMSEVAEDLPTKIARLLREGRAAEVTDDMLGQLGPNDNARLVALYEQGATGVPMPMDEASRMGRAREMGFGGEVYHGTNTNFEAFDPEVGGQYLYDDDVGSMFLTSSPKSADHYAMYGPFGEARQNANTMPVRARESSMLDYGETGADPIRFFDENPYVLEDALSQGNSGIILRGSGDENLIVSTGPEDIRSRFARFDPRLARNANLLASLGGAGLLGMLAAEQQEPR